MVIGDWKVNMANTLDIVESCLSQIYSCRKSLLHRKVQSVTAKIEARQKIQEKLNSLSKVDDLQFDKNDEDDEQEILVKSLTSSYPVAPKPSLTKDPPSSRNIASPASDPKSNTSSNKTAIKNTNDDEQATITKEQLSELKKEFDTEVYTLEKRFMEGEIETELDDELDSLISKYFNRNLDRAPPSAEVSALRQYISQRVEYIAGLEPPPKVKGSKVENENEMNTNVPEPVPVTKKTIDTSNPEALKARLRTMMKPKRENGGRSGGKTVASEVEEDSEDEEDDDHQNSKEKKNILNSKSVATQQATKPSGIIPSSSGGISATDTEKELDTQEKPRSSSQSKRVKFVDESQSSKNIPDDKKDENEDDNVISVPSLAPRAITPGTQRKQQEKLRIKEQYEKYLQSKQKLQHVHEQVHDRENLAADIQSVLNSLRNTSL